MNKKGTSMLVKVAIGLVIAILIVLVFYNIASGFANFLFGDPQKDLETATSGFDSVIKEVESLSKGQAVSGSLYHGAADYWVVGFSKNSGDLKVEDKLAFKRPTKGIGGEDISADKSILCLCKDDGTTHEICIKHLIKCSSLEFDVKSNDERGFVLIKSRNRVLYYLRKDDVVYIDTTKESKESAGVYTSSDEIKAKIVEITKGVINQENYIVYVDNGKLDRNDASEAMIAVAKQESQFTQFNEDGSVYAPNGQDYGMMQINKAAHPSYFKDTNTNIFATDLCGTEDVTTSLDCNIKAGATILLDGYIEGITKYPDGKVWCNKYRYTGWDYAFRDYNGWGCTSGDPVYIENINKQLDSLGFVLGDGETQSLTG